MVKLIPGLAPPAAEPPRPPSWAGYKNALFLSCCESNAVPLLLRKKYWRCSHLLQNPGNIVPPPGLPGAVAAELERAYQAGVRTFVVCGHHPCSLVQALVDPAERAIAKGIPVVIIDSALKSDKIVSYVATDNYHGGVLAAERLAELLKGQGKIILMRYMVGSASTEEREAGFTDTIKKFPGITYLSQDQYAGATSDTAQKTAQNLATRFKGQVDGVFCPNESSTSGMLRALREAGLLAPRK